jgi:hypothetical protein
VREGSLSHCNKRRNHHGVIIGILKSLDGITKDHAPAAPGHLLFQYHPPSQAQALATRLLLEPSPDVSALLSALLQEYPRHPLVGLAWRQFWRFGS